MDEWPFVIVDRKIAVNANEQKIAYAMNFEVRYDSELF